MQNLDPAQSLIKEKLMMVKEYMRDRKVPVLLYKRVKIYFEQVTPCMGRPTTTPVSCRHPPILKPCMSRPTTYLELVMEEPRRPSPAITSTSPHTSADAMGAGWFCWVD